MRLDSRIPFQLLQIFMSLGGEERCFGVGGQRLVPAVFLEQRPAASEADWRTGAKWDCESSS